MALLPVIVSLKLVVWSNGNHGDLALVAGIFIAVKTLLYYKVRSCFAKPPVFGAILDWLMTLLSVQSKKYIVREGGGREERGKKTKWIGQEQDGGKKEKVSVEYTRSFRGMNREGKKWLKSWRNYYWKDVKKYEERKNGYGQRKEWDTKARELDNFCNYIRENNEWLIVIGWVEYNTNTHVWQWMTHW